MATIQKREDVRPLKEWQRRKENVGFILLVISIPITYILREDYIWVVVGFFLIAIVTLMIGMIEHSSVNKEYVNLRNEDTELQFSKMNLNKDHFLFNDYSTLAIGIDEVSSALVYLSRNHGISDFKVETIPFDKILDVTVSSNNSTVASISKAGLVGGTAVGGALFGGFGSVVGAMSANKNTSENVHYLNLIITLDDLSSPIIKLDVISSENGISKQSDIYQSIMNDVDLWFSKFTVILKRNEKIE